MAGGVYAGNQGNLASDRGGRVFDGGGQADDGGGLATVRGDLAGGNGDRACKSGDNACGNGAPTCACGEDACGNGDDACAGGDRACASGDDASRRGDNASTGGDRVGGPGAHAFAGGQRAVCAVGIISDSAGQPRGMTRPSRTTGLPAPGAFRSVARMDKLEEIFRMQDALNQRIGVNLPPPTDEEKAKWILNYTRAMQQETAELIDSVPWKWWAKYQKFDEQNAKVEVVDLFHFLVSLAQTLGMTADDVYQAYLKKNAVNHQRQDSGYVKKDEADSKHI